MGDNRALLRTWWRDPVDHRWLVHVLETHSVLRWEKWSVGAGGFIMAVITGVTTTTHFGPSSPAGRAVFGVVFLFAVLWALRWWFLPWPSATESLALFAGADIAIFAASFQDANRVYGVLGGTILLVVTGTYLTFFHSPKVLAAHSAWSVLTALILSGRMLSENGDIGLAITIVLLSMSALVVALPALQFMFWVVQTESLTDPLTQLLNRRGFEFRLTRLFTAGDPTGICIMIADLDRFKRINDSFGHSAGDDVLVRTAQQLAAAAGPDLVISRTGGEEFAVVGRLSGKEAWEAAEMFRRAVSTGSSFPVTVSIGIAVMDAPVPGDPPLSAQDLLQRADSAMYEAKQGGGNRVVMHEPIRPGVSRS